MPHKKLSSKANASRKIVDHLGLVLSNTYLLYTKTQNFHWNVVDKRFYQLHKFWEEQYEELAKANDLLAERIRMLGHRSPGSMKEFLALTSLKESSRDLSANQMIEELVKDHEALIKDLHVGISLAEEHEDQGTADLFIQQLRSHEKMAWMLRSSL